MKHFLLVQTKRFGDIIQAGKIISELKEQGHSVSLLCFQEFKRGAELLSDLDQIHTIDRKKIITFYKNHIYSDCLSFQELFNSLEVLNAERVDYVVNLANDRISTSLSSYLASRFQARALGMRINKTGQSESSDFWSLILNDVVSEFKASPYSLRDTQRRILNLSPSESLPLFRVQSEHEKLAKDGLRELRRSKNTSEEATLIGIQLKASEQGKEIPRQALVEFVQRLNESEFLIPLFIIAPFDEERELANQINEHFNNEITCIEADFIALHSVLKNIDYLVTPDTAIKHIADAIQVKTLEVSLGNSPTLLQGATNSESVVLTRDLSQRSFKIADSSTEDISSEDLYQALRYLMFQDNSEYFENSTYHLLRSKEVRDGNVLLPVSKNRDHDFHLTQITSRLTLQQITDQEIDPLLCVHASEVYDQRIAKEWIQDKKNHTLEFSKSLLKALKVVIQASKDIRQAGLFVQSLDELLEFTQDQSPVGMLALIFRGRIESLSTTTVKENIKEVESLLYELKDFIQAHLFALKGLEIAYDEKSFERVKSRMEDINQRSAHSQENVS